MIQYDVVLEDLPERVRELTVRLRDMVLSLGAGLTERVAKGTLEYGLAKVLFVVLAPDRTGASLRFPGSMEKLPRDTHGRLSQEGGVVTLRMNSAADIDDAVRRVVHDMFVRAQGRSGPQAVDAPQEDLSPELTEALGHLSRTLRLLCHHLQVQEKQAKQKAASASRVPQKRSHKKKPPAVPPPLFSAPGESGETAKPAHGAKAPRSASRN